MKIVFVLLIAISVQTVSAIPGFAGDSELQLPAIPEDWRPSAAAIKQSNLFAVEGEIEETLQDGWQHQGFKTIIDSTGSFSERVAPSTVVDRARDPVLRKCILECRKKFESLPVLKRAEAVSRYVAESFSCAGCEKEDLYKWYDSFCNSHRGERIPIGLYLKMGRGVCEQDAILQKVLFDELGIKSKLIFGYDRSQSGHLWCTAIIAGQELVFDPSMSIFGTLKQNVQGHRSVKSVFGKDMSKLWILVEVRDLQLQGEYRRAAGRLGQVAAIEKKRLGSTHPHYAVTLERQAALLEQSGMYHGAEKLFKDVAEIYGSIYGYNHHEYADSLHRLGRFYASIGADGRAQDSFMEAVSVYQKSLGSRDNTIADSFFNLARLKERQGEEEQAASLYKKAFVIYKSNKGKYHQDTQDAEEGWRRAGEILRVKTEHGSGMSPPGETLQ